MEKRKLANLKPFERNPRTITKASMEKLKSRIKKRGFHDILKVDTDNVVLSGNMRRQALQELGIEEIDVKVPSRPLTPEERNLIVLESNKLDGEWDTTMLPDFGSETLLEAGFESIEVDGMMVDEDDEDIFDEDEELGKIKKPEAKPGNIYKLGDSFLMCGDSTKKEDVDRLMGGGEGRYDIQRSSVQYEFCEPH